MKQFLFLIFCTLSAAFVSCKEETDGAADFRFVQPEVTDVTQTTANVSSRALFTLNDYPGLVKGFAYGPADEAAESYRTLTVAEFERNAISARLTGLVPGTRYRVHAYVELGASRIMSDGAEFATLAGGDAPVLEIVSETTLSVPAAGGRQTIRYEVLNPAAGVDVTAAGDVTWLTSFDNAEYGVISFEVGANEGAARSGVVTLSYTGADDRTVVVNRQVFYYSNIAPQYSRGFNTGGGGWNILEDWIDKKVCADTTYLVIGTYFEKYTDRYGNSASPKRISFGGRNDVSCPTMFYIAVLRTKSGRTGKSVLDCSADELMCAAFVRCHNNNLKGKQVSAKDMYSIRELEELTGHTFFSNVPNAPKDTYKASDWGL